MRTTIELVPELMQAAKSRAINRGESLKEFFARAIARELGTPIVLRVHQRVTLPLILSKATAKVAITNQDIEELFAAEDSRKYGNR